MVVSVSAGSSGSTMVRPRGRCGVIAAQVQFLIGLEDLLDGTGLAAVVVAIGNQIEHVAISSRIVCALRGSRLFQVNRIANEPMPPVPV